MRYHRYLVYWIALFDLRVGLAASCGSFEIDRLIPDPRSVECGAVRRQPKWRVRTVSTIQTFEEIFFNILKMILVINRIAEF